jgi:hypothetical protein
MSGKPLGGRSIRHAVGEMEPEIDITFDFRSDARGKDPDSHSPTLRRYHRFLWSKPLPGGVLFALEDLGHKGYLRHKSERGEFLLSSDTIFRTFSDHRKMQHIITQVPEGEREEALRRGYTIGGMILFPGVKVGGKNTINQARGMSASIQDRFDLTLECIRRHYLGAASPLSDDLARYAQFFALFEDFQGYVDFFLLQDLVTKDYSEVRFWAPFTGFSGSPLPVDLEAYGKYRGEMLTWVDERNARIAAWCSTA